MMINTEVAVKKAEELANILKVQHITSSDILRAYRVMGSLDKMLSLYCDEQKLVYQENNLICKYDESDYSISNISCQETVIKTPLLSHNKRTSNSVIAKNLFNFLIANKEKIQNMEGVITITFTYIYPQEYNIKRIRDNDNYATKSIIDTLMNVYKRNDHALSTNLDFRTKLQSKIKEPYTEIALKRNTL